MTRHRSVPERRYVFLDPDGTQGRDWLYVIVRASTGICYEQQYGGTATRSGHVEGYLVPVRSDPALAELRTFFERHLRGAGAEGRSWPEDDLRRLRGAVAKVVFWESAADPDGVDGRGPRTLELDESRLGDLDEAWVPVLTADGPGVLVWQNSD